MTLHYLSLDRGLQDRIVSELTSPPPDNTRLIKACIRETLRMSATAGGNARCMQNDVIISGYFVPKGVSYIV
jgi:Cytochrome P450